MLLFGTMEEIAARRSTAPASSGGQVQTIRAEELASAAGRSGPPAVASDRTVGPGGPAVWSALDEDVPPLPQKLSPAQAARLAEILDYLHRGLTTAVENIDANEDGTEIRLGFGEWQTIQAVQMLLARYARRISEPDSRD
jgi:hypothetical protein